MEGERQKAKGKGRKSGARAVLSLLLVLASCLSPFGFHDNTARAQAGRRVPGSAEKKNTQQKPDEPKPAESPTPQPTREADNAQEEVDEGDAVRVETNLVTLPVVASDRGGRY